MDQETHQGGQAAAMSGRVGQGPMSGLSDRMGHEVVYQMGTPGAGSHVGKGKVLPSPLGRGLQQDFMGDPGCCSSAS